MSIFTRIKDAIFGHKTADAARASTTSTTASTPPRQSTTPHAAIPASPADAKWERPAAERDVDVELVLESMASKNKQQLNWRTSIVDLMKLLGIDSSLENRKELARELGYTGSTDDSASMNIWLHKRVMEELQKNGGKVPASLVA
jgi:hypothetical protein